MQWQCYCCVASRKSVQYKVDNKTKIKADIVFFLLFSKNSKKKKGMASKYIQISAKRKERKVQCK